MMIFKTPLFLLLIPIILGIYIWHVMQKKEESFLFSSTQLLNGVRNLGKAKWQWLPNFLRIVALIVLIIALAGPRNVLEETEVTTQGIDIVLAVDSSTSMAAEDFVMNNKRTNRLEIVKSVIQKFVEQRKHDKVGLIAFAGKAYTVCPLTTDHDWLNTNLKRVNFGFIEDGTAIGSAIASAVSRLKQSEAKSKVIILLTDGVNNSGKIEPIQAAKAAQALDITIYTIGAGTQGYAPYPVTDIFGKRRYSKQKVDIDEVTLKEIAKITSGQYFRATDTKSLQHIYDEINELEKTEIQEVGYYSYEELFWYFALAALACTLIELFLRNVIFLKIP